MTYVNKVATRYFGEQNCLVFLSYNYCRIEPNFDLNANYFYIMEFYKKIMSYLDVLPSFSKTRK